MTPNAVQKFEGPPYVLSRSYAFNKVIGADLEELDTCNGASKEFWLNVVCWGYGVRVGEHKTAVVTIIAFMGDFGQALRMARGCRQ